MGNFLEILGAPGLRLPLSEILTFFGPGFRRKSPSNKMARIESTLRVHQSK
jgi:hypothetical protein